MEEAQRPQEMEIEAQKSLPVPGIMPSTGEGFSDSFGGADGDLI